jgi:hypothetical protein
MKYARKTDTNHAQIVQALRAMGVGVYDTSMLGKGFPDLVTAHRGVIRLVEVKDGNRAPSATKLTVGQAAFRAMLERHACHLYVVHSVDEAIRLFGGTVCLTGPEAFAERAGKTLERAA